MKKIRFIALILMFSMLMMGIGYSAWTDTIVLGSTVATGELSVDFVNDGRLGNMKYPDVKGDEYVKPEIISLEGNMVQIRLSNLYPGARGAFRLMATNSGTIPVRLDALSINLSGDEALIPYLTYRASLGIDCKGDNNIDIQSPVILGKLKDFSLGFDNEISKIFLKYYSIQPGGNIYLGLPEKSIFGFTNNDPMDNYIVIQMDEGAPQDMQNKSLTFTFTINFKQYNAN